MTHSSQASRSSGPKFNTPNVQQIYIAPHCIRYTNSTLDDTVYRIDDESLNEIASEILEAESVPPKLQIVFYANRYYAINNSHLQVGVRERMIIIGLSIDLEKFENNCEFESSFKIALLF